MSFFSQAQGFSVRDASFTNVAGDLNYNFHGHSGERDEQDKPGRGLAILYQSAITSAFHDSEQRFPPPNVHPGTRVQILEILRRWILNGSRSTSVYWLSGPAGVGKSAVAQTISEEFSDRHKQPLDRSLVASFFFARADSTRNNLRSFFTTIAHQLATNPTLGPLLRESIDTVIRQRREIMHATLEQQFQELIVEPCSKLELSAEDWKTLPRLIVIDGLDECIDIASQERLLSILSQAKTEPNPPPFDFLICSRPEPRIRNAFSHRDFHHILDCNDIGDSFESGKDIARYFGDEFGKIRRDHGSSMAHVSPSWPGEGIIQQLVKRACGQFIYASTVLKYIGDYDGLPTENLEIILNIIVPEDYDSPYPDLDLLYMQILSTCKHRELLLDVIGHLLKPGPDILFDSRYERKSSSCIEGLFFLATGKVSSLLVGLHSVLSIPNNDVDDIRVHHASFSDFLTDPKRSGSYFVDRAPERQHERIARYLLKRISHSINNHRDLKYMNSEFDTYAWDFWYLHCRRVTRAPSIKLLSILEKLDLCGFINTALRRRSTSLEACVSWLRKCLTSLESIAHWAETQSRRRRRASLLDNLPPMYRIFSSGFRIEMSSNLSPEQTKYLLTAVSVLKYDYTLHRPNMWDVISSLLNYQISAAEVGSTLRSPWPCPPIYPLTVKGRRASSSSLLSDSHTADSVNIIFADCHKDVVQRCLQILREPSQHVKEAVIYAKFQWINHALATATAPSEDMLQTLLQNAGLLQTSEDLKKAIVWVEGAPGYPSRARTIQQLEKHMQHLVEVEEGRRPPDKKKWHLKIRTAFRVLRRR